MLPNWYLVQLHLGPIPVNVWGLFVAAGFLVGTWLAVRLAPRAGIAQKDVVDVAVWAMVAGMLGARLGHVLLYDPAYYLADPLAILRIWEGGLSSFGGFTGAVIAAWLFIRKHQTPPLAPPRPISSRGGASFVRSHIRALVSYTDLLLWPLMIGWFIGRLGCYAIHDHAGIPCNGYLCVPFPDGVRRLDMGVLDGLLALVIFLVAWPLRHRFAKRPGAMTAFVCIAYGLGRFTLDFLRVADATYLGLTPAQYGSVALVMGGAWLAGVGRWHGMKR
ncbi:MAG: prolipoprotein diacylglyceryl transferase [bacterium]|nr:prolipoprotein diacylglyceryl transferase [bacterium]